jgi:hypothetical protein
VNPVGRTGNSETLEGNMYPVSYAADPAIEGRNRLTTFFRPILDIPWLIVAGLYGIGAYFAAIYAWFVIVFTGKYPEGAYNFNAGFLRMSTRANGFAYLLTDEYPSFDGDEHPEYPVRVGVPPALDTYDRLKTGLRLIYGIPVYLLAIVQSLILAICQFIGWFAIVFTGKLPGGLFDPLRSASAYLTRAGAYFLLMTEDYPPFSYEEGAAAPAGQIPTEAASRREQEPQ